VRSEEEFLNSSLFSLYSSLFTLLSLYFSLKKSPPQ